MRLRVVRIDLADAFRLEFGKRVFKKFVILRGHKHVLRAVRGENRGNAGLNIVKRRNRLDRRLRFVVRIQILSFRDVDARQEGSNPRHRFDSLVFGPRLRLRVLRSVANRNVPRFRVKIDGADARRDKRDFNRGLKILARSAAKPVKHRNMSAGGVPAQRDAIDMVAVFLADLDEFREREPNVFQNQFDTVLVFALFKIVVVERILHVGGKIPFLRHHFSKGFLFPATAANPRAAVDKKNRAVRIRGIERPWNIDVHHLLRILAVTHVFENIAVNVGNPFFGISAVANRVFSDNVNNRRRYRRKNAKDV